MNPSFLNLVVSFFRSLSTVGKLIGIGILSLLLLIPLSFVSGLLQERQERRAETINDIISTWGPDQQIVGPILVVPFRYTVETKEDVVVKDQLVTKNKETVYQDIAYFLPNKMVVDGKINPMRRHKGIYEAVLYDADLHLTGEFAMPNLDSFKITSKSLEPLWDRAYVALPIRDLRGVREALKVKWADHDVALEPGSNFKGYPQGLHGAVPKPEAKPLTFALTFQLHGSGSITFAPVGMNNQVHLSSTWSDPSFNGSFLPITQSITKDGFVADWSVSYYGRNFPQQWRESDGTGLTQSMLDPTYYGVGFPMLVDAYRNVERAIKYGILFIALMFVTFFLFETLTRMKIHTMQYTLVGAALVLFYLALLSLSEFLGFALAYGIAVVVAVLLITFYTAKVLHSFGRSLGLATGLLAVYSVLYVILQLQDYSLVVGTTGLFVALAAVMYVTRNMNWYQTTGPTQADKIS